MEPIMEARKKYDPLSGHVRPHITLVFPFGSTITDKALQEHVDHALASVPAFPLTLHGVLKSQPGNYLFLDVELGKDKIIDLHNRLYTGILAPFRPKQLDAQSYCPHMTIGRLPSEQDLDHAYEDVQKMDQVFHAIVNKVSVEGIDVQEVSAIEMEVHLHDE